MQQPLAWFIGLSAIIVIIVVIVIVFTQSKSIKPPVVAAASASAPGEQAPPPDFPGPPPDAGPVVGQDSTVATDDLPTCESSDDTSEVIDRPEPFIPITTPSSYFTRTRFADSALNLVPVAASDPVMCEAACSNDKSCVMFQYSAKDGCKKLRFFTDPLTGTLIDSDRDPVYYTTIIDQTGNYVRSYRGRGFTSTFTPQFGDRIKAINACKESNRRKDRLCTGVSCMEPSFGPKLCQVNYLDPDFDSVVGVVHGPEGFYSSS